MPEFFVPTFPKDSAEAEHVWNATREFMATQGWKNVTDRRIFRLGYLHDGKHMEAEVGKPHPYSKEIDWEAFEEVGEEQEVLVILEHLGGPFLVCTPFRGVLRDAPILVGGGEPYEIVYFDGFDGLDAGHTAGQSGAL